MPGRIGTVGYLNARPLTCRIDTDRYALVADHPAAIAAALVRGEVDVALVPIAAVLDGGDWRIAPGVCIGADGPVDSVLLVAETPPEAWTRVVLDGESRTSAVLARLLLTRGPLAARVPVDLEIVQGAPGVGVASAVGSVAALVIGDAALALPDRLTERVDLAATWKAWTGLPFVFAVWAGRPGVDPGLIAHLRIAGRDGVAAIGETWTGAERTYLQDRIRYTLDDAAGMGMRRFAALAHQAGLLASEDLQLYGPSDARVARPEGLDALLLRAVDGEAIGFDALLRIAVAAPLAELAAAADAAREAARPTGRVAWDLAWRMTDPERVADAVAAGATRIDLPADVAGDVADRLAASWPDVRWVRGGDDGVAVLSVGAGETDAERVGMLIDVREDWGGPVRIAVVHHPGRPVASEADTATDVLRAVALARLALGDARIEVSVGDAGLGVAQVALRAGADALGPVYPDGPFEGWAATASEIVRHVRAAGLVPDPEPDAVAPVPGRRAAELR